MTNEIKEILAYFEEYIKITDMHDSEPMLNWKDLKIVLDYITNLHEENKRSQQKINKALNRLNRIPDGFKNINAYVALIVNETKEILQGDNKE